MSSARYVHEGKIFRWPCRALQAIYKGLCQDSSPLYDLTSGENKDKKSERVDLPPEALEAFERLKAACLQAPILAFPDFNNRSSLRRTRLVRASGLFFLKSKLMDATIPSLM